MNTIIGRMYTFDAAHKLPNEEIYGMCSNLHGHRYELVVEVYGECNEHAWVCNFSTLDEFVDNYVLSKYDHAFLNDYFDIPTVEILAKSIYDTLQQAFSKENFSLNKIKLFETGRAYAIIGKSI